MKFTLASLLLLAGSAEAATTKSQAQMQAEIEAMSMNTNMHQVSLREKTLLKTYLEVDMNEYFQSQMDSKLFEGIDESEKAKFVGNFFHFIKCRFNDCNLIQTGAKIHIDAKNPSGAVSKVNVDKQNMKDWSEGKGNFVPAWSKGDEAYVQTGAVNVAVNPSAAVSKGNVDKQNMKDWASGKGNDVPAWSSGDPAYIQTQKQGEPAATTTPATPQAPVANADLSAAPANNTAPADKK